MAASKHGVTGPLRCWPAARPPTRSPERLGLSVPHEWWPSAALLKSYEAAGFSWVQLHSPPASVLSDPRNCRRHAGAVAAALASTGLSAVVHAPGSLRLGPRAANRAFEGLLSYAAECGATQIIYHGLAFPDATESVERADRELRALAALAGVAERLAVTIAIENLAPVYPGPETISANPLAVRGLVRRIDSAAVRMCLDIGHAHVVADARHTSVELLCAGTFDVVSVIHLHDNFGARRKPTGEELGVDPLRLDLHLAPGRGTLDLSKLAAPLVAHEAPLICEVHPPYRPRASELAGAVKDLLGEAPARAAARGESAARCRSRTKSG